MKDHKYVWTCVSNHVNTLKIFLPQIWQHLFEGVCVETTVIFAQGREECRSETAARVMGTPGIFGAQTLHWPRFYARPPPPSESGSFFRQNGLLVRDRAPFFFGLRHLSSESANFHDFRKNLKNNHFESRFAVLHKISVFALGVLQKSEFGLPLGFFQ